MEIKVGQLCRFYSTYHNYYVIHKILNEEHIENIKKVSKFYDKPYKTADNLEDLLEIFDIVHWYNKFSNKNIETIIESFSDIYFIKNHVNNLGGKITAIELHENRKPQQIGE